MGSARKTLEYYKALASSIHSGKYDYSLWIELGMYHDKIDVVCPTHGHFRQSLANHITRKSGCPKCRDEAVRRGTHKLSSVEWEARAHAVHGQKYEYDFPPTFSNGDVDYINVKCPVHGWFKQLASVHVRQKAGCPKCARTWTVTRPHPRARYSPLTSTRIGDPTWLTEQHHANKRSVTDIAIELGVSDSNLGKKMKQLGVDVVRHPVSGGERELAEWIGGYASVITSDRTIISPQELDVVLPEYKIAVEYCGLYWHSDAHKHPKYHAEKLAGCNAAGYRLITVYEDEWKTRTPHVQGKILSLINKDARPIVHPRACEIRLVPPAVKKEFFEHNHIQGDGPSSINIGLYHQGDLVACMGFISRSNRVYILNRYAASCRCPGGFSKLLHHFKQRYEWTKIESFADLRWSDGNLYHQTGFVEEYTIPPDYYWTDGNTRIHKFSMRHQFLKTKLEQYDPTLTEDQNCRNHGLYKIFDCGKIKFSMLSSG